MSSGKVVLITGANTGLGLEIVKALYKTDRAYQIIIGCRTVSKGEAAMESVQKEIPKSPSALSVIQVDLSSDESINNALKNIESKFGRLDVLINNGGGNFDGEIQSGKLSVREAWNISWDTNVAGTQVLTTGAVPLLLKSSDPRLMFITSGTSSILETENTKNPPMSRINASPDAGWPKPKQLNPIEAYRSSKAGLNMMMRQWHRILLNDGVKVWGISPGFLATGLAGIGREQLLKVCMDRFCKFLCSLPTKLDGCYRAF
jgi:NAD(P)-dependent dehydrogenase (short-subunit alcohol dehydrogenase family)